MCSLYVHVLVCLRRRGEYLTGQMSPLLQVGWTSNTGESLPVPEGCFWKKTTTMVITLQFVTVTRFALY